jgi:hypothetical protein
MCESASGNGVLREFGSEAGMRERTRFVGIVFEGITIWTEHIPSGTQNLKPKDIIEELRPMPNNIRKFISGIILSPLIILIKSVLIRVAGVLLHPLVIYLDI